MVGFRKYLLHLEYLLFPIHIECQHKDSEASPSPRNQQAALVFGFFQLSSAACWTRRICSVKAWDDWERWSQLREGERWVDEPVVDLEELKDFVDWGEGEQENTLELRALDHDLPMIDQAALEAL